MTEEFAEKDYARLLRATGRICEQVLNPQTGADSARSFVEKLVEFFKNYRPHFDPIEYEESFTWYNPEVNPLRTLDGMLEHVRRRVHQGTHRIPFEDFIALLEELAQAQAC